MNTLNLLRTFPLLLTLLLAGPIAAQEVLTNEHLIQMAELGMGESIILSRIDNANNDFDASTSALVKLKAAGLSDAALTKVIEAASNDSRKVVDANDPLAPHRPGIYYHDEAGNLVELLPTVMSQSKTRGAMAMRLSYGIAKMKTVARLAGPSARKQFSSPKTFYFYFNDQSVAFDPNTISFHGFKQSYSPNEFTLAQLDMEDDSRELETGSANNYSTEFGIDERHARIFEIENVAPGIFKVSTTDLAPGEYCFVYSGSAPQGQSEQRVFDFGIQ
jgi:hypothetical protein